MPFVKILSRPVKALRSIRSRNSLARLLSPFTTAQHGSSPRRRTLRRYREARSRLRRWDGALLAFPEHLSLKPLTQELLGCLPLPSHSRVDSEAPHSYVLASEPHNSEDTFGGSVRGRRTSSGFCRRDDGRVHLGAGEWYRREEATGSS